MNWLQVTIHTSCDGLDRIVGELYSLGITGLETEDEKEFLEHLKSTEQYWDYVDESLKARMAGESKIKLYLADNEDSAAQLEQIKRSLNELKQSGAGELGTLDITVESVCDDDWESNWRKYFKPTPIGRVLICPLWEPVPEDMQDKIVFKIEPGMVFGTGTHESTRICIEAAQKYTVPGAHVLDLGCGSGILSIIALLLGAKDALAVDIDKNAKSVAESNALINGINLDRYTVITGDLIEDAKLIETIGEDRYDLIFANIVADVIIAIAPNVAAFLKFGGTAIFSGIITERADEVAGHLVRWGLAPVEMYQDNGWVGIAARKA
ncbi:MAG TPA: 50S ribosomal protein L11 methyltransferase [Clostridia bacterium]|nr:50S ribosomal protein L11 methyltransferase [Clostridia bacterium]